MDFIYPEKRVFARNGMDSVKTEAKPGTPKLGGPGKVVVRQYYCPAKLPQVAHFGSVQQLQSLLYLNRKPLLLERFQIHRQMGAREKKYRYLRVAAVFFDMPGDFPSQPLRFPCPCALAVRPFHKKGEFDGGRVRTNRRNR